MQREGPQCHPDGFELISGVKLPASTFRSEWLRLYEQSDHDKLNPRRSKHWMDAYIRGVIKYQYGNQCTLCKEFIDIRLQCQPHYRPIRLADVPDPPVMPKGTKPAPPVPNQYHRPGFTVHRRGRDDEMEEEIHRPFHKECWWIYQNMAASKRRRIRYHAKRNPADPPEDGAVKQHALPRVKLEDGAVEQHAPPLASEAGAAEPLLPPSIDDDAVEQ